MSLVIPAPHGRFALVSAAMVLAELACVAMPATSAAQALTLAGARRLAARDAPQIDAQSAALRAAREASVGAAELPDPKLIAAVENLPVEGGDKFSLTRDFMTMRKIGFAQDFPRGEKLRLRGERADAEVRREAALLVVAELNLERDVALAWIDVWFAEQGLAALQELQREAQLQVAAAEAALAGGKGQAADPFSARISAAQFDDRVDEANRSIARARAQLARWIPGAAQRPLAGAPAFDRLAHRHEELLADLEGHPHLAMYGPMQAMAETDVRLAQAAKNPDWSLEVAYAQRGPAYTNMVTIGVRIDLPIFEAKRQNPAIASRLAAAEQVRAQAEDAKRMHAVEIRMLMADWQSALERARRFASIQIPLARQRSETTLAAYRGGKGDLTSVLEARKAEVEARLAHLQVQAEMARAWAGLSFLLPVTQSKEIP